MFIIVRTCGERTTEKCIELCQKIGQTHIVNARPFGESIRKSYGVAIQSGHDLVAVIDADVMLYNGALVEGMQELKKQWHENIFCYDGQTHDKVLMKDRRAGVHIYNTKLLKYAFKFIDDFQLKPETYVRKNMKALGYPTFIGKTIFGLHDYEQYYRDLWRKAVCQTQKLPGQTRSKAAEWLRLSKNDIDYKVIYHAHEYGKRLQGRIIIDVLQDYDAKNQLKRLGIEEKPDIEKVNI